MAIVSVTGYGRLIAPEHLNDPQFDPPTAGWQVTTDSPGPCFYRPPAEAGPPSSTCVASRDSPCATSRPCTRP